MAGGWRLSAEELILKLKDDGDFDNLRLAIIRKVKENEELRNSIINEVRESAIFTRDDLVDLKPRQISDGIYQEVGSKLMGQISDEVWKVIKTEDTQDQIKQTVESVYDRIINPKPETESHNLPLKQQSINGSNVCSSPLNSNGMIEVHNSLEQQSIGDNIGGELLACKNDSDDEDTMAPPGFAQPNPDLSRKVKVEILDIFYDQQPSSSRDTNVGQGSVRPTYDKLPPGFAPHRDVKLEPGIRKDEDPEVPPGFG